MAPDAVWVARPVNPLPLPVEDLPESVRRFVDPAAPMPARAMAARGVAPVKGADLVCVLVQLSADAEAQIANSAKSTLGKLPETALSAAVNGALPGAILAGLLPFVERKLDLAGDLVANPAFPGEALVRFAKTAPEVLTERIAENQARLLANPAVIESLYLNPKTRMSTVDRLVELAARNGVALEGVATFEAHVEAIQGQLIPEAEDDGEPLPQDLVFQEALELDGEDDAVEDSREEDDQEAVKEIYRPLAVRIDDMSTQEKIRLSLVGNAAARALLVRDRNKLVYMAAISSPALRENEAVRIAASRQVEDGVLRYIGNRRDWGGNYELKKNLLFNPKTPIATSMKFLAHMRDRDLKDLTKSKNVPGALRTAGKRRIEAKQKKKKR
jgi:hypothetical protein